jgi:hypothetical protein
MVHPRPENPDDPFWREELPPALDIGTEPAALAALDAAVTLAREGDYLAARRICATVVFHAQPSIAAQPALLRAALHALLVAHGFRLLSRVIIAITGSRVDVTLLPECTGEIEAPRRHDEPRRTAFLIDPRWLDKLSPDDQFLTGWCEELTARDPGSIATNGLSTGPRQLEPT